MPPARLALVALVGLFTGGCYVYEPVEVAPPPGTDVRLRLTAEGALAAEKWTGEDVRRIAGTLLSGSPDTLTLQVLTGRETSEFRGAREFRADLAFPRSHVETVERRKISWLRTSAVTAAALGAAIYLVDEVAAGGDGDGDGDSGNGRLPLFVVTLPSPIGR